MTKTKPTRTRVTNPTPIVDRAHSTASLFPNLYPHSVMVKVLWQSYPEANEFMKKHGVLPIQTLTSNNGSVWKLYDEAAMQRVKELRREYDAERQAKAAARAEAEAKVRAEAKAEAEAKVRAEAKAEAEAWAEARARAEALLAAEQDLLFSPSPSPDGAALVTDEVLAMLVDLSDRLARIEKGMDVLARKHSGEYDAKHRSHNMTNGVTFIDHNGVEVAS